MVQKCLSLWGQQKNKLWIDTWAPWKPFWFANWPWEIFLPWTWNWYKLRETCQWNTLGTRLSMEHETPFGNSNRENEPTFLDLPLFLGIFQWDEPTKRVPFTAEPEILTKWKAPQKSELPPCGEFQSRMHLVMFTSACLRTRVLRR